MNPGDIVLVEYHTQKLYMVCDAIPMGPGDMYHFHHFNGEKVDINPYFLDLKWMRVVWPMTEADQYKTDVQRLEEFKARIASAPKTIPEGDQYVQ